MDASIVLTLVQTFMQVLDSPISREIQSVWGYKSQLQKLKGTMSTIENVLFSIEEHERLQLPSRTHLSTLKRLKEVVYEADDLFDEIAILIQRKKLSGSNKLSQEVRLFFSRSNQFRVAFTKSREIKKIREILNDIARDHRDFGKMQRPAPTLEVKNDSRETYSFVREDEIIGRDDDKEKLIDLLLDSTNVEDALSVVSIVGIGGLGKTALAQSVYNDSRIKKEFQLTMWVCVSDDSSFQLLLRKILAEATKNTNDSTLSMEQVQINLTQKLQGNKYLLVLDDIWDDDPIKWLELRNLLSNGGSGSKIIVTTRSMTVANAVGSHKSDKTHELKGLSEEDSWNLFERMTSEPGLQLTASQFHAIGDDIVRKCANVPLALKFIGSLLRGQHERTWLYIAKTDLSGIKQDKNGGIIPVLKISYNYLSPSLKSCFADCAVFPKDYVIMKEHLIYHWMAQGFIMPLDAPSLESQAEECFENLLQRCFFQDVQRDEASGVIISCKMHDLVHDLAKDVAGIGIKSSSDESNSSNEEARHVFFDDTSVEIKNVEIYSTKMERLRTCLVCRRSNITCFDWLPKMIRLRVLDLSRDYQRDKRNLKSLPSKIGDLVHLRYLNLSHNEELFVLPNSITQLINLRTLNLKGCKSLMELPKKLSKLVNLRHLDILGCEELRHMPPGMNRMTCLSKLTMFVVGGSNNGSCGVGELEDLKYLDKLRDMIEIKIKEGWTYDVAQVKEGGYLINKSLLHDIKISWDNEPVDDDDNAEALLQGLQPHRDVKKLRLNNYPGVKFPSWGEGDSLMMNLSNPLPNLVELHLDNCTRLKHVPLLSQLDHLKVLTLRNLRQLEYVERRDEAATTLGGTRQAHDDELVFFPSLVTLALISLPELKGWWKASANSDSWEGEIEIGDNNYEQLQQQQISSSSSSSSSSVVAFPCLSCLRIHKCPNLTTFPSLPNLRELYLLSSSKALGYYDSLPRESFQHLTSLSIVNDDEIERLFTREVFRSGCLSSIRSLCFHSCRKLKRVSEIGVWEHFTALESLTLINLEELEMEDNEGDMPWRCLASSLRHLYLSKLPKIGGKLPMGMRHLTALRSLQIFECKNLEEIPKWISCLTSLQSLEIWYCPKVKSVPKEMSDLTSLKELELYECSPELEERCKEGSGDDWHIIKHIPYLRLPRETRV